MDDLVNAWFEPMRGRLLPDKVFEVASHLGDWGLIWLISTFAMGLRNDDDANAIPRRVALFGLESLVVNQGLKRIFKRGRPDNRPDVSTRLREPITSSFPSGHASSGAFAYTILTRNNPSLKPIIGPIAILVATSRIHTKMHHPTDVAAGALVGWMLGELALRTVLAND